MPTAPHVDEQFNLGADYFSPRNVWLGKCADNSQLDNLSQ